MSTFFLFIKNQRENFRVVEPTIDSMTPNPENLMKITGYAHSSDDENSALSNINLVETVDGLTKTPAWYVVSVNNVQKVCLPLLQTALADVLERFSRNHAIFLSNKSVISALSATFEYS